MHKLKDARLDRGTLEFDWNVDKRADLCMDMMLGICSVFQDKIQESQSKEEKDTYHRMMKGMLPESFIQTRTVNLNYQVLQNMYAQRKNHRLPQWNKDFVEWVKKLPYSEFITGEFDD